MGPDVSERLFLCAGLRGAASSPRLPRPSGRRGRCLRPQMWPNLRSREGGPGCLPWFQGHPQALEGFPWLWERVPTGSGVRRFRRGPCFSEARGAVGGPGARQELRGRCGSPTLLPGSEERHGISLSLGPMTRPQGWEFRKPSGGASSVPAAAEDPGELRARRQGVGALPRGVKSGWPLSLACSRLSFL